MVSYHIWWCSSSCCVDLAKPRLTSGKWPNPRIREGWRREAHHVEKINPDDDFETRLIKAGKLKPPGVPKAPEPNGNGKRPVNSAHSTPGGANPAYLRGAVELAASELAAMPKDSGRNDTLNIQAWKLAHRVELEKEYVKAALISACITNGLVAEDGELACLKSFDSGWNKGRAEEPWEVPTPSAYPSGAIWIDPPGRPIMSGTHTDFDPRPHEQDFWQRESLARIFEAALGRMCSPWAITAYCVARALALVQPRITLPPTVGARGSLNFFATIISKSGGGKSIANDLAAELVPKVPNIRNLGSGEGIIGQFRRPARGSEAPVDNESVMFIGDEGDVFNALNSRNASTTLPILKSAFSGGVLGFSYITRGRDVYLNAHEYRMTLVINMQPAVAGPLMDDVVGGTPQRFAFFPGNDPRFDADIEEIPLITALNLPPATAWQHTRMLTVPEEARITMRKERVVRALGKSDPFDGHLLFWRAKFAFGLAVLDGRTDISSEDWRLAGIATDVSCACRTWLLKELDEAERKAAQRRGMLQGVAMAEQVHEKDFQTRQKLNRVAAWAAGKLQEAGRTGMTRRELDRACFSRDRSLLEPALQGLLNAEQVSFDAGQKRWAYLG